MEFKEESMYLGALGRGKWGGAIVKDGTPTSELGDRREAGPDCRAPGRSWPDGCGDGLGAQLRPLWAA